jgi:hypothetical protein
VLDNRSVKMGMYVQDGRARNWAKLVYIVGRVVGWQLIGGGCLEVRVRFEAVAYVVPASPIALRSAAVLVGSKCICLEFED